MNVAPSAHVHGRRLRPAGLAWAGALVTALALLPRPGAAQTVTLRPTSARVTVQTQSSPFSAPLAVVTNVDDAFMDDDATSASAATVFVDREVNPAVTSTSGLTANSDMIDDTLSVLEDLTADPLLAGGDDIRDFTDGTRRETLDVGSVSGMTITINGDATENHAAGNLYYQTVAGSGQIERRLFGGGLGSPAGHNPPIIVTGSTLLDSSTNMLTLTPTGDAALVVVGDRLVDVTAVGNTEVLTVQSVDVGLGTLTFTANATETHPAGTNYLLLENRREPPDLAAEFGGWREFPSLEVFDQRVQGNDIVTVTVTLTADSADDTRTANTGVNADDNEPNGTRDTPDLPDEWLVEFLFDTNVDGFFDQIDTDLCDGVNAGIGAVTCGIVEVGRASDVAGIGGTVSAAVNAPIRNSSPDQPNFSDGMWVRVRNERIAAADNSQVEISDVKIDVTVGGPSGSVITLDNTTNWTGTALKNRAADLPQRIQAIGGTPPYVWTIAWQGGSSPPGTAEAVTGANMEFYDLTDPGADGVAQAGAYTVTFTVDDSAMSPPAEWTTQFLVDGLELIDDDDSTETPLSSIPSLAPGERFDLTLRAKTFTAAGLALAPPPNNTATWTCTGCTTPTGLTFTPTMPVTARTATVNLAGTPITSTYDFTNLTATDSAYSPVIEGGDGGGTPDELAAFMDSLGAAGTEDIRILAQAIPAAVIGLRYTSDDANFPPLATLRAVNAADNPPAFTASATWTVTTSTGGVELPPAGQLALEASPATATEALIVGADLIDLSDANVAGTYTFTVRADDDNAPGKFHERDFSFKVLARKTIIKSHPPRSTGDPQLRFTVFGSGGVPSAGTGFAPGGDEVRDNGKDPNDLTDTAGVPHYQYQYRIDPQILPGDDPADDDDAGKFMGDAGVTDVDYQSPWLNPADADPVQRGWVDLATNASWTEATSPKVVNIDLNLGLDENGASQIVDPPAPKLSLKPSALAQTCTPRNYRIRFRAVDAITRGAPNVLAELGATPFLDEATIVITLQPPEDCAGGISSRQERFD